MGGGAGPGPVTRSPVVWVFKEQIFFLREVLSASGIPSIDAVTFVAVDSQD